MRRKLTTTEFIAKAKAKHGEIYDYSKVVYVNIHTKVTIIDPAFGEFTQTPTNHINGQGHPERGIQKRADAQRMSKTEFITKAKAEHGGLYNYSLVKYVGYKTKVIIIDPYFGEFTQTPDNHLHGHGHPKRGIQKSADTRRITKDEFMIKANKIHDDLYDYSLVVYVGTHTKVTIIDPDLGEFTQTPDSHLQGCGHPDRNTSGVSEQWFLDNPDMIESSHMLYVVVMEGNGEIFVKTGITRNGISGRFPGMKTTNGFQYAITKTVHQIEIPYREAWRLEQQLHRARGNMQYVPESFGGSTECSTIEMLPKIRKMIKTALE